MSSTHLPDNVGIVRDANGETHLEQIVYFDPATEIDTLDDQLLEETKSMTREQSVVYVRKYFESIVEQVQERTKAKTLRICIGLLLDGKNAKLAAYGIAFGSGLGPLIGQSMTQVAVKLKVTKAAVSKAAIKAAELLEFVRSRYMKSEDASEAYSNRQIKLNIKLTQEYRLRQERLQNKLNPNGNNPNSTTTPGISPI